MNNLPRQKLCEIIKIYGKDVCSDHKRIRGLLNDFCSGNHPEINFLLAVLEEQVYTELVASSKIVPYEMLSARLVKRLYTNRGMAEEIAHWAVDSWALALGVISNETRYTKPQVSFSTPLSGIANAAKSYANTTFQQTIVVSPTGGQYTSISAALKSAMPNTIILVKPGHYYEGFIINKRVEIRGDGPIEQIIIESRDTSCIQMRTDDEVLVQGLTLRCRAKLTNQNKHAVEIPMGRLKLTACDITSDTWACVRICGPSTHPEIQGCWLHDANGSGLLIERNAQGTIENCYIFGNSYPNISIRQYADPVVKKCKIYGGRNHGILVWENGSGTVEDCDIFGNAYDGLKVKDGGTPTVRGCRIYKNAQQEEWVYHNGMGNTRFPEITETPGIPRQRGHPETRSKAISTSVKYTTENVAHQQEVTHQPEKRQNIIGLFLRSIRFSREK